MFYVNDLLNDIGHVMHAIWELASELRLNKCAFHTRCTLCGLLPDIARARSVKCVRFVRFLCEQRQFDWLIALHHVHVFLCVTYITQVNSRPTDRLPRLCHHQLDSHFRSPVDATICTTMLYVGHRPSDKYFVITQFGAPVCMRRLNLLASICI